MFAQRDRFELGVLGLMLLAWGLLVAPALHAITHAHGHPHHHSAPTAPTAPDAPHGAGSVEHLLALATPGTATPQVVWVGHAVSRREASQPRPPDLERRSRVEVPQGP